MQTNNDDNSRRHKYRALTETEEEKLQDVWEAVAKLREIFNGLGGGRSVALAMTNLDQAEMWAVRRITD